MGTRGASREVATTVSTPGGSTRAGADGARVEVEPPAGSAPVAAREVIDKRQLIGMVFVAARVAKPSFRPLEPIAVGFEIRNSSRYSLETYGFGIPGPPFAVTVFDETMREVPKTRYYHADFERSKSAPLMNMPSPVRPGGSATSVLIANWPYDMTAPGRYSIVINLPYQVWPAREEATELFYVKSDPVRVEVRGDPMELLTQKELPIEPTPPLMGGPHPDMRPGLGGGMGPGPARPVARPDP